MRNAEEIIKEIRDYCRNLPGTEISDYFIGVSSNPVKSLSEKFNLEAFSEKCSFYAACSTCEALKAANYLLGLGMMDAGTETSEERTYVFCCCRNFKYHYCKKEGAPHDGKEVFS
jgi:hypothetical protein